MKCFRFLPLAAMMVFFIISCGRSPVVIEGAGAAGSGTAGEAAAVISRPAWPGTTEEVLACHAERLLSLMTLKEKCSQVLFMPLNGSSLPEEEAAVLRAFKPGGIILFKFNIPATLKKVKLFTAAVSTAVSAEGVHVAPFIAVDHEGGIVQRFRDLITILPPPSGAAETMTPEEARTLYLSSAGELKDAGISMNLGPVLEPLTAETGKLLAGRSFSADPDIAAAYGGVFIAAMNGKGVLAVAKHFPGSGGADPHALSSVIDIGAEEFASLVYPFREAVEKYGLRGVMMSHAYVDGVPALMSAGLIEGMLRKDMRFTGLVISDDLIMSGLSKSYSMEDAVVMAVAAGCDMVIYSGGRPAALRDSLFKAVQEGRLPLPRLNQAVRRILIEKLRLQAAG
ncbi:MAG: hypothetical protein E4H36_03310 [Spirochaetales bacterium]|nr:MAG: hypothetical protein E4H36_03310 [Spirochaetales bacterium]